MPDAAPPAAVDILMEVAQADQHRQSAAQIRRQRFREVFRRGNRMRAMSAPAMLCSTAQWQKVDLPAPAGAGT